MDTGAWSRLGGGVGGRVYHRSGDVEVVKVIDGDVCYRSFVNYVLAHPAPWLPVLRLVHWDGANLWGVVHIERLDALTSDAAARVDAWWTDYLAFRRGAGPRPALAEWTDFVGAVSAHAPSELKCLIDIKPENVMLRGDEVVFIDPLN